MTIENLEKELNSGKLNSLYLLYGEELFLLESNLRKIKTLFGECIKGINYILIDEQNVQEIISDIETSTIIGNVCNISAIIVSILFAYVTNRSFVFKDKAHGKKAIMKEMTSFFACRIFTMVVDTAIYWIGCTTLKFPALIVKMVSQVVVIVLNYVFSKLIVFKKKSTDK